MPHGRFPTKHWSGCGCIAASEFGMAKHGFATTNRVIEEVCNAQVTESYSMVVRRPLLEQWSMAICGDDYEAPTQACHVFSPTLGL